MPEAALTPARPAQRHHLSIAPMLDWTDRHYRFMMRALAPHARLYTEMITTGAILHGHRDFLLDFDASEHPLALQLGGSEPEALAACAQLAAQWGYDEVNLNVGCPSPRVQRGAFGACLMKEPTLVAECVQAMREACALEITVKHRIGVDEYDDYDFLQRFVATVHQAGGEVFIVHARKALLQGLSPKENRDIPPLRYEVLLQLRRDFPQCQFVLNGGLNDFATCQHWATQVHGLMIGRKAYHEPMWFAQLAQQLAPQPSTMLSAKQLVRLHLLPYLERCLQQNHSTAHPTHMKHVVRHWLGLFQGQTGARHWRRSLSDPTLLQAGPSMIERLLDQLPDHDVTPAACPSIAS